MKSHPLVKNRLLDPLNNLLSKLKDSDNAVGKVPVFFVFDEIVNLVPSNGDRNGDSRIHQALRRVIRLLSDSPVWCVFLSTRAAITQIAPPVEKDPSARVKRSEFTRCPPFYSFPLDVHLQAALFRDLNAQLSKPLAQYAQANHMTMIGRPLWRTYAEDSCRTIRMMALDIRKKIS